MSLGLSHSLSRYKLKFSPDKVQFSTSLRPFSLITDPPCHQVAVILRRMQMELHVLDCSWLSRKVARLAM